MRYRRIVCFLMGAWIGVSAMLAFEVYRNFDAVDAVLKSPPEQASRIFKTLGPDNARILLRYTAGVQNANTFEIWEDIQFAIGLLTAALLFLTSSARILSAIPFAMTLLVAFEHFKLTPELAWLGRSIEFVPWTADSLVRDEFWKLHRVYAILETSKCLLGAGLTVFLSTQQDTKHVRRTRHRHEIERAEETGRRSASR